MELYLLSRRGPSKSSPSIFLQIERFHMIKTEILTEFALFSLGTGGIGSWLTSESRQDIFERLAAIEDQPLSAVQLNQLLVLGHEAPVSDACFRYYWLQAPDTHPYDVRDLPDFSQDWIS